MSDPSRTDWKRRLVNARLWKAGHARLLVEQVFRRDLDERSGHPDAAHLRAAVEWLERCQDSQPDGGFAGRYRLDRGWTSSYPETTGYIVPTLLALADRLGEPRYLERARRAIGFLLGVQLESGAFPGGEVAANRSIPSVFNTGQILNGLTNWAVTQGDDRARQAAIRAAEWLVSVQDPDGAWRRHVYYDRPSTYSAHASCWLAECGQKLAEPRFVAAAARHARWCLSQIDTSTGWVDLCGFTERQQAERRAYTHTIAYTLWGLLLTAEIAGLPEGIDAVERAATAIARRLELSRRLAGVLDHQWRGRAGYACLTGNVQMALIWFRLYELRGDARLVSAAYKAIDLVELAQPLASPNPALRGGIPGSDPIWGDYIHLAVPNWAAKFFIDALLAKERVAAALAHRAPRVVREYPDRPAAPEPPLAAPASAPAPSTSARAEPSVVLYTKPHSQKLAKFLTAWQGWGFRPAAVVIEHAPPRSFGTRLGHRLRAEGTRYLAPAAEAQRGAARVNGSLPAAPREARLPDPADYCRAAGLRVLEVGPLSSPEAVAAVAALGPDLAIHAGAGILRAAILAVPRWGTLNAHMGILPEFRGMNVAEWAAWEHAPVGPSVHLIDPGIDTGPVLAVEPLDVRGAASIAELRRIVDEAQIALLGRVLQTILATGELPTPWVQPPDSGRQYFRMHTELARQLEAELAAAARV